MRKSFTRFLSLLFVFCLVAGAGAFTKVNAQNPAQETVKLYASSASSCFKQPNIYSVTVSVQDFNKLSSFDLGLTYPGSVFSYVGATTLPGWTASSISVSATGGTVSLTWAGSETSLGTNPSSVVDIVRLDFALINSTAPATTQNFTWSKKEFHYTMPSSPSPLDFAFTGASTNGSLSISQSYPSDNIVATFVAETCFGSPAKVKVTSPTNVYYSFNGLDFTSSNEFNATPGSNVTIKVKSTNGSADGCISYAKTVTVPVTVNAVTFTPSATNPSCPGGPGSVLVAANGGSGAYLYYYNTVSSTTNATTSTNFQFNVPTNGTSTVTYYVAVQDGNGCVDLTNTANWKPVQVVDNNPVVTLTEGTVTNVTCNGGSNGAVSVSISPAAKYMVSLNGGTWTATSNSGVKAFMNLKAGTYTITAKTLSDCTISDQAVFTVAENPALVISSLTVSDTSCGSSPFDGKIAASISGGTGSYTISIAESGNTTYSPANSASYTFSGLKPVYYSLSAVDGNGCVVNYSNPNGTGNVIAVQKPTDINFTVSKTAILCYGDTSTLTVTNVSGGTGSYTYTVEGVGTKLTPVFGGLAAGTYTVTVANASGVGCAISLPVSITQPGAALAATATANFGPTCSDGSDGDIMVTITGIGTPGYKFALNGGPLSAESNSSVLHIAATVGNHTIKIVDHNGCVFNVPGTVTVTQNANVITASAQGMINCYGAKEGKIVVPAPTSWATGSVARVIEYKYSTDEASVFTSGSSLVPVGGTGTETTLYAGTYYVGGIDQYGCKSNVVKVEIKQNPQLEIVSVTATGASCYNTFDGTITIVAKGGTASNTTGQPLQFAYVNNVLNPDVNSIEEARWQNMTYSSTTTFKTTFAVGKGDYYVFVRDRGCAKLMWSQKITVTGYDQLKIDESKIVVGQPLCNETKAPFTGSISVPTVSGGNGSYLYTLYKGNVAVTGKIQQTASLFGGLASGTYTVKLEDSTGCPSYTTSATFTINYLTPVVGTVTKTNISCNGAGDGYITISADGGTYSSSVTTAQYSYAVNNQSNWNPFVGKSKTYIAIQPGTFTFWVKDINGCTSTPSVTVTVLEPATISATATVTKNADCTSGGSVAVTASGGWTGGTATTTFAFKLDNGSYGSTGSSTVFTGLAAGTHSVTVQARLLSPVAEYVDNSECVKVLYFTITQPDAITYSATVTDVKCKGGNSGSMTVTVLGGGTASSTGGYQVEVTGPSYDSGWVWTGSDNTITFDNLYSGIYTVYVKDKVGCTIGASVGDKVAPYSTVESWNIQEPVTALGVSATRISNSKCALNADGVFTITANGGVGPYKFFTAKAVAPPTHILIPDANDASAWMPVTDGSTYTKTNADKGTWIVWAQDTKGCITGGEEDALGQPKNEWRVQITAPDAITFSVGNTTTPTCNGKSDGSIAVNSIIGGTPTYTVTVAKDGFSKVVTTTGTASSVTVTGLPAGSYTITVSDANGCLAATATKTINDNAPLSVELKTGDGSFSCPGVVEGWIEATGKGGTGSYQYRLYKDNVLVVPTFQTVSAYFVQVGHTYTVEVKDALSGGTCTATASLTINDPVEISATFNETTCFGDPTASVTISVTGNPNRSFTLKYQSNLDTNWTNGGTFSSTVSLSGLTFANKVPGLNFYTFVVTDNKGCTKSFTRSFVPTQNELKASVAGVGGTATLTIVGGIAPYSYQVGTASKTTIAGSASGGSYSLANLVNGTNSITVFDDHGCPSSSNVLTYVADLAAPTATYSPNGTTTDDNHPALVITFNENVAVGSGNITIKKKSDNSPAIAAIPASALTISGKTATITYAGGLDKNTDYYVVIDGGVVKDLAGNAFAGVTATNTWTFKTGNKFATPNDPEVNSSLKFKVYPNPFVDVVKIDSDEQLAKVVVTNIAGQVVKEVVNPGNSIQLDELRSGVYFITLYVDSEAVTTVKLLKR